MYKLKQQDGQLLFTIALVVNIVFQVFASTHDLKDAFMQSGALRMIQAAVFSLLVAKIMLDGIKFSLGQIVTVSLIAFQAVVSLNAALIYIYSPWRREILISNI